jgi:pimeloyl-ACP methyl ester carboxylesterase
VFVSCAVPEDGSAVFEILATFSPTTAEVAEHIGEDALTEDGRLHPDLAAAMFCTEMSDEQRAFTLDRMVPEAVGPVFEPVDLSGLRADVPRTYVRLLRDASLTVDTQDRMIANLGDADVVDLDAGHMAMISHPAELAAVLGGIARA